MKTIIAGSRTINDYNLLLKAIKASGFKITHVISGGANGADRLGEAYANEQGISLTVFEADWEQYGKAAGVRRNKQMAEEAEALIALWDGKSKGTANMIRTAMSRGLKVHIQPV